MTGACYSLHEKKYFIYKKKYLYIFFCFFGAHKKITKPSTAHDGVVLYSLRLFFLAILKNDKIFSFYGLPLSECILDVLTVFFFS